MRRLLLGLAAVVVLAIVAVALGAGAMLNSDPARARIVTALQRATGHPVRIDGSVGLAWSAAPRVAVSDLVVLNPAGFSRPDLLSVRRVEAELALWPLLQGRVEIPSVSVTGPDLLLERDAAGRGNWEVPPPPPGTAPSTPRPRTEVTVGAIEIADGRAEWRGLPAVAIRSLSLSPSGGKLAGSLALGNTAFTLSGKTGARSQGAPFEAVLAGGGVSLAASGRAAGTEAAAAFQVAAVDLAAAGALVGRTLPPLRDVVLTGQAGAGGLGDLKLVAGASELGSAMKGLHLVRLEATTVAPGQPVAVAAQATVNDLPVNATLAVGAWGDSVPVSGQVSAEDAAGTFEGTFAPHDGAPRLAITARVPDLQRLGRLAGVGLPRLTKATLEAHTAPAPGGSGLLLRGLELASAEGDVAGDVALGLAPRPSLRGSLQSRRLDFDGIAMAMAPSPQPTAAPPSPTTAPVPPAPTSAPAPGTLISDRPLPFGELRRFDADLRLAVAEAVWHGAAYRGLDLRAVLQNGTLRIDPATAVSPGGPLAVIVAADANAVPPTASVAVHAPAIDAAGLSAALGAPGAATGTVDVDADLHGAGASAHALAGSATGHLALSLTEGEIENAALAALFGPALRSANIPIDAAGRSHARCAGVRFELDAGQAAMPVLGLDTTRVRLDGDGRLDLGAETMDLHLRPVLRLGPTTVTVPVRVSGPFRTPRTQADKGAIAPGRFGIAIGGPSTDPCAALAAARAQ